MITWVPMSDAWLASIDDRLRYFFGWKMVQDCVARLSVDVTPPYLHAVRGSQCLLACLLD